MKATLTAALLGLAVVLGSLFMPTAASAKSRPANRYDCPASNPIKGNINPRGDRIYHVPGSRWYRATHPEVCFYSVREARANGFRAPYR